MNGACVRNGLYDFPIILYVNKEQLAQWNVIHYHWQLLASYMSKWDEASLIQTVMNKNHQIIFHSILFPRPDIGLLITSTKALILIPITNLFFDICREKKEWETILATNFWFFQSSGLIFLSLQMSGHVYLLSPGYNQ
jgi:hypothetical protein